MPYQPPHGEIVAHQPRPAVPYAVAAAWTVGVTVVLVALGFGGIALVAWLGLQALQDVEGLSEYIPEDAGSAGGVFLVVAAVTALLTAMWNLVVLTVLRLIGGFARTSAGMQALATVALSGLIAFVMLMLLGTLVQGGLAAI